MIHLQLILKQECALHKETVSLTIIYLLEEETIGLTSPLSDGNDRIAFTGEHHGFAAPVGPEGKLNYTFPRMARSIKTMMAVADKLAAMDEERDNISFAFIPDYYMTEYRYPQSEKMAEVLSNIEANRGSGSWESMGRAMLLMGYRFGATDIQNKPLSVEDTAVLALPSAKYMDRRFKASLWIIWKRAGKFYYLVKFHSLIWKATNAQFWETL